MNVVDVLTHYPNGWRMVWDYDEDQLFLGNNWACTYLPLVFGYYQMVEIVEMSEDRKEIWLEVIKRKNEDM